jgi:hypothetical protein
VAHGGKGDQDGGGNGFRIFHFCFSGCDSGAAGAFWILGKRMRKNAINPNRGQMDYSEPAGFFQGRIPDIAPNVAPVAVLERRIHAAAVCFAMWLPPEGGVPGAVPNATVRPAASLKQFADRQALTTLDHNNFPQSARRTNLVWPGGGNAP